MDNIEDIKKDFMTAGYSEKESVVLAEEAIKFKSTVAEITLEEAIGYLKQTYNMIKL
jgi:hypothetical protein